MSKYQLLICGCLLILGCTKTEDRYAPVFKLFNQTEVLYLSIDNKEVIDLYPDKYEVINFDNDQNYFGGYGYRTVVLNDNLFIVSNDRKSIIKYNLINSNISDPFTFQGDGPGEYKIIDYVSSNGNHLFILDRSSYKLAEYDQNMNHINDHILKDFSQFSFNDGIALDDNSNVIYPIESDEEYLIKSKSLSDPKITDTTFHKRIIALGKQPTGYNNVLMEFNNRGKFALASKSMPLIFLYDGKVYPKTMLRIKGEHIDQIDESSSDPSIILNPPPINNSDKNKTFKIDGFSFMDFIYNDNQIYFYFSNRYSNERYLIILENKIDEWIHLGSYRFKKNDQDLVTVSYMAFDDPWLFLGSKFEENIIRVNVNKLLEN